MNVTDETRFGWELDERERAQMGRAIQLTYIDYWHQTETPRASEFQEFVRERRGVSWQQLNIMMDEAFGGYSGLVRSMGETPNNKRVPQDAAVDALRGSEDIPELSTSLEESHRHGVVSSARSAAGSYSAFMEAMGVFDEYIELVQEKQVVRGPQVEKMLGRREEDMHTLIEAVEQKFNRSYGDLETKYEVE